MQPGLKLLERMFQRIINKLIKLMELICQYAVCVVERKVTDIFIKCYKSQKYFPSYHHHV